MKIRTLAVAGVAAGALLGLSGLAGAQPAAPAAPATPQIQITHGPVIPGVCYFNEQATIGKSLVGQAVVTRLQQLVGQVRAEISPQEQTFATDARAFEAARATLDAPTAQKRAADLNLRRSNLDHLETQRQQELEYTQQHQLSRIDAELAQVLPGIYQTQHCSILINGQAVIFANPGMDLTNAAVTALNARIQTLTFDRETPPPQTGGAQ